MKKETLLSQVGYVVAQTIHTVEKRTLIHCTAMHSYRLEFGTATTFYSSTYNLCVHVPGLT